MVLRCTHGLVRRARGYTRCPMRSARLGSRASVAVIWGGRKQITRRVLWPRTRSTRKRSRHVYASVCDKQCSIRCPSRWKLSQSRDAISPGDDFQFDRVLFLTRAAAWGRGAYAGDAAWLRGPERKRAEHAMDLFYYIYCTTTY